MYEIEADDEQDADLEVQNLMYKKVKRITVWNCFRHGRFEGLEETAKEEQDEEATSSIVDDSFILDVMTKEDLGNRCMKSKLTMNKMLILKSKI